MQTTGLTLGMGEGVPKVSIATTSPATKIRSQEAAKLKQAAGQFESILLANLWKSMKSSFAEGEADGDSDDPAHGTLEDFGMRAMSDAVGKAGGLGIGRLILQHLEPRLHSGALGAKRLVNDSTIPADIPK